VTEDPDEAHRSPVELAVLGRPAALCAALAEAVGPRENAVTPHTPPPAPEPASPLRAGHVLAALAERLPREAILIEETPSSRPELHARIPATAPLGFISAMGMLGFALPAAIGVRMARPDRPVLTVVGDGSSLYQIQALWSAATYGAGVLFIVLRNGGYAIMNRLAERAGNDGPWPALDAIDIAAMARAQGCDARRIETHDALLDALDELLPTLKDRTTPLLLETVVAQDPTFDA
jgi:benzoylformate decarboxylase